MNMQAMMRQVQNMKNEITKIKDEIDNMEFSSTNSFVTVFANGKKEILKIEIDNDSLDNDDVEMLQDILVVALNDVFKKIDDLTEKKMSKYGNIPGLF